MLGEGQCMVEALVSPTHRLLRRQACPMWKRKCWRMLPCCAAFMVVVLVNDEQTTKTKKDL